MNEATHPRLTCRLHVHHRWETRTTEDGGRYQQCRHCGKDRTEIDRLDRDKSSAAAMIGFVGGGF
jgi:hypothetical protein